MRSVGQLLLAALVSCSTGPGQAPVKLDGVAIRGPVAPVCREGVPCDLPFAGEFDVERGGRRVARFRSDDQGRFEVWLAPGDYLVRWVGGGLGGSGQTQPVTVKPPSTTVELRFDTGIR